MGPFDCFIPPRVPEKKGLDRRTDGRTDGQQSDPIRVPFFPFELGDGVELTLGELRAMALRQQQQIDTQHQLLCAKEQRLRYLKQQEARHHQKADECVSIPKDPAMLREDDMGL
ncbi:hypothetical protein EVAR_89870_1 [Eumeta japonica]|uniref:Uncharacterized protein n=1 Tax=Eumeta variegata TaxID=151549 RepID=A0A4C1ZNU3_EUMVA|nr:hypothetical protein EVAR_89870_1 [Eumeta japonica]